MSLLSVYDKVMQTLDDATTLLVFGTALSVGSFFAILLTVAGLWFEDRISRKSQRQKERTLSSFWVTWSYFGTSWNVRLFEQGFCSLCDLCCHFLKKQGSRREFCNLRWWEHPLLICNIVCLFMYGPLIYADNLFTRLNFISCAIIMEEPEQPNPAA